MVISILSFPLSLTHKGKLSGNDYDDANDHHNNCGNNNFGLIYNYLNCASDNDHDSIHALDNQFDAIVHRFGSEYMEFSK